MNKQQADKLRKNPFYKGVELKTQELNKNDLGGDVEVIAPVVKRKRSNRAKRKSSTGTLSDTDVRTKVQEEADLS